VGGEAAAAKQFHAREGSLHSVPRKAVEQLVEPDGTVTEVLLGTFVDNARRRADKLTPERRAELDALGMRWWATSQEAIPLGCPDRARCDRPVTQRQNSYTRGHNAPDTQAV
jgi:hypothetical protein